MASVSGNIAQATGGSVHGLLHVLQGEQRTRERRDARGGPAPQAGTGTAAAAARATAHPHGGLLQR